jgi:hypothetical protein
MNFLLALPKTADFRVCFHFPFLPLEGMIGMPLTEVDGSDWQNVGHYLPLVKVVLFRPDKNMNK